MNTLFEETISATGCKDLTEQIVMNYPELRTYNKQEFKKRAIEHLVSDTREQTIKNLERFDILTLVRSYEKRYK